MITWPFLLVFWHFNWFYSYDHRDFKGLSTKLVRGWICHSPIHSQTWQVFIIWDFPSCFTLPSWKKQVILDPKQAFGDVWMWVCTDLFRVFIGKGSRFPPQEEKSQYRLFQLLPRMVAQNWFLIWKCKLKPIKQRTHQFYTYQTVCTRYVKQRISLLKASGSEWQQNVAIYFNDFAEKMDSEITECSCFKKSV